MVSRQWTVQRITVTTSVGSRAVSVDDPQAWNQLLKSIRQMDCIATFKRHLITIAFLWKHTVRVNKYYF